MSFQVGDRVELNPESPRYDLYNESQSKGDVGTIFEAISGGWRVKWDNGHGNGYATNDLIPVVDESNRPRIYKMVLSIIYGSAKTKTSIEHNILAHSEEEAIEKAEDFVIMKGYGLTKIKFASTSSASSKGGLMA